MKILVCGGAGYIGSHMVMELLESSLMKFEPVVFDNLEVGHRAAVPSDAEFIQGDMRNPDDLERVFLNRGIEAVIDFSAYTLVGESCADPMKYFKNNTSSVYNLLEVMNRHDVGNIVFSSTAAVYGIPETLPATEESATMPINPYGESKLGAEKALKWADFSHGIRYAALRYFNVAGAHPSGNIGEDHFPESHLIPNILFAARDSSTFTMSGTGYNTPDGTCIRDYVHVCDLAAAHVYALKYIIDGKVSDTFNIGTGAGFSNMQIFKEAESVVGKKIDLKIGAKRPGDPDELIAWASKIAEKTGWTPKCSNLEEIIASAYKWHTTHPRGYDDKK